jgi:two-component system OmpR family response regulator
MREAGHQATHANNGDAGMALAAAEQFDVMIFDRQLPAGVDGADLLKALRTQQIFTPVLFLSGLGDLQDWIKGLDAGGDDYIVKPFSFADLLTRVEALHARHVREIQTAAKV